MSKPTDTNYTNDRREREALIAELGQEEYDKQRKEAKKEREARQPRANRAEQRRQWKAAGAVPKRRGLRKPPQHPLSKTSIEARIAAEVAELEAQLAEQEVAA